MGITTKKSYGTYPNFTLELFRTMMKDSPYEKFKEEVLQNWKQEVEHYAAFRGGRDTMMITYDNYYDIETNKNYFSASQIKDFMKCEAYALAKINGEWEDPAPSTAMLVGSYVDAYFTGNIDRFIEQHPEVCKKDGTLKANFDHAETIISRIERDDVMMQFLGKSAGSKAEYQKIFTTELVDEDAKRTYAFKAMIDVLHRDVNGTDLIVDLKIVKDFKPVWDEALRVKRPWIEAWGYDLQLALYSLIAQGATKLAWEKYVEVNGARDPDEPVPITDAEMYIAAATKESEPDIGLFKIPWERADQIWEGYFVGDVWMPGLNELMPRFAAIKSGDEKPTRCGKCDYCKATKKLDGAIDYREIGE
jgi:hypothetical protein